MPGNCPHYGRWPQHDFTSLKKLRPQSVTSRIQPGSDVIVCAEMDEQWGYVGAKSRQRWLFYAYDRLHRITSPWKWRHLKSVIVPSVQSPPSMLKLHDFCNRAHTSIEHSRDWCRSLLILNCQELAAQQPLRPINWCSRRAGAMPGRMKPRWSDGRARRPGFRILLPVEI